MMRVMGLFCLALASVLSLSPVQAQTLDLKSGDAPLEVFADDGIEWQQDGKMFFAQGNARAVRGDVTVTADVLRAYYREKPGGGSDIWRLDADGSVVIASPGEKAHGEHAVYDVDNSVLVLKGGKKAGTETVRLVTPQDTITAKGQVEYWQAKRMAVARGDAVAVRTDKRLSADVLVAYFKAAGAKSKSADEIEKVDAFDNVRIDTATDTVTANRGAYNVQSGIATLTGSVKIVRGDNVLDGCKAVVNLNTGISRLFGCGEGGKGRVHGILTPSKKK